MQLKFAARASVNEVEEGIQLAPRFDAEGLLPVVVTDAGDGMLLMLGYMNAEALSRTVATGEAHYFSRSRQKLWRKGETSGLTHKVERMLIDDDQDALWLQVTVAGSGASCHVGYRSCFYRALAMPAKQAGGGANQVELEFTESKKLFDADATYAGLPNPTKL